jgi:hypothetical protein
VFHIRNTQAFWRGHRVSPAQRLGPSAGPGGVSRAKRPGPGRQTAAAPPLPPSPHGPFRRSRAVFSQEPLGVPARPASGREPFSSLKAPYGCRGGRPSSPGPIRPCAAFPWLPTATTLPPLWPLPGASRAPAPAGEIHGHAPAERRGCGGHGVASVLLSVHGDLRGLAFWKQPVFDKK